jgi:hypothetical protein
MSTFLFSCVAAAMVAVTTGSKFDLADEINVSEPVDQSISSKRFSKSN